MNTTNTTKLPELLAPAGSPEAARAAVEAGADALYLGGTMLDEVIVNAQQSMNLRSGGQVEWHICSIWFSTMRISRCLLPMIWI